MLILEDILSQEVVQRLGWTLVHFIWQAAVIALLVAILLKVLRKSAANLRYIIACMALGLIVLLPVITIQLIPVSVPHLATHIEPASVPAFLPMEEMPTAETIVLEEPMQPESVALVSADSWTQRAVDTLEPALPYIVSGWLIGVFGLSLWHLGGWTQLQRLKRRMVKQVDDTLSSKLKVLAQRLRVKQTVQLMESALVQIPTVVGWLRPVILLPASALTGLSAEQLEAILAHELAHIKRVDYLVNMLQTVVEILGFYHPAVWWVSHKIRAERENCCDDLAVSISGDRVCYARALTSMEEIRAGRGQLAVAATGGNLFRRIRRLVSKDSTEKTSFSWIPAATAILLIVALLIPTVLALTTHNGTEHTAESLLDKMVEHRSKVKNVQFVAEYDIWHAGYSEEYVENIRKSMRERGTPEQQLQRMTRGFSRVPQSRYQILKCTIDNEERAKIERTTGTYDSSGKKLPSGDKNISAWNGVLGINFNQRRGFPGSAIFKDTPPTGASRQGQPWKTFTGNFCRQLAEAIKTEKQIRVDESKDGTYRVVFDNDPIIKIAVIYPSQGYSCILNENYNKEKLAYRSTAKYKEVAKGIWFPVSGQTESYAPDGSLSSKSTIETSQIKINDPAFNKSFFDVDLPEGTEVRDTVQGKHYVVGSKNVYELPEPQQSVTIGPEDVTDGTEAEIPSEIDPNAWQKAFYAVYRLKDGEILKRIAPPFIPERRGYFLLIQPGRYSPNTPHHVARLYFNWDGKLSIRGSSVGGGIPRLNSILESVIGLGNFEYDIPSELLQIDMSGDWIVRKNAPVEDILKALEQIVKDETGREIGFVKKRVEAEVIIARGKYRFEPLPGTKERNFVLICTDKMDTYSGGGGGSGTVSRFLRWVGNRINMYIIDETESEDIKRYWRNHDSSDLRRLSHNKELYNERLDMLLSNLTRQTGLTFERKTAAVEKWFIAEEGAVNAPQKTKPVPAENVQDSDSQVEVKRALSADKLKQLGLAVAMYADDHDENLPQNLQELKPYIQEEQVFDWLLDNAEYFGSGKSAQRNTVHIPIAYDKSLFIETDATNVLFLDFSVRFLHAEQLEKLGIKRAEFLIEARFLSVREDFLQNINLDADSPDEAKALVKLKSEMLAASDGSKTQSLILDERNVSLFLKAVRANKDAIVLAAPQILTREGKTAEIKVVTVIPFFTGYTEPNNPSEKPEPKFDQVEEGITMSLRPKLTQKKNVDMQFELEITQALNFEERMYKGKYPYMHFTVEKTTQATRYIAKNGQTLLCWGHKISKQQDGRTKQKDLLVLIKTQTASSSEQDKSAQAENVTVSESTRTTSDVIMPSEIVQSRIEKPDENVQESDSQVEDDILLATEQEKESSPESIPVPVLAKSPTPSAKDKAHVQVDCLIVEVSPDLKMDRETTIIAENLLGNKISLRDTKAVVLLRKAAKATAAIKDKSAENKRVTQKQFEALVDMLTSKGYLRILMNPRIQVVDGKTAKIMSTQKISSTQESIEDSIQITPHVPGDGHIILQVEATISSKSIPKGVEQIPIITTREVSTLVTTSPGESLMIIGGLKETGKSTKPNSNVKDSEKQTTELLLILTPTIITPATDSQEKTDVRIESKEAMVQRVYDISDLIETAADVADLICRITETIEPDNWYKLSDKGEGTITPYPLRQPKKLAVMQNRKIHQKITRFLEDTRSSQSEQEKTKAATEQKPLIVRKLIPLQHHDASKMAQIIRPLLSHTGHISADERTNSLLVIDTAENLMRIEKIIAAFDVSVAKQTVQKSFKLKYRSPSQMAQILRPLLTKTGYVSADESTGILLLIDTPENLKRIEKIIAAFDVLQAEQTVQKFFKLKYYSPSQMAQILMPLLTKTGYISADENTGNLLVIDTVENLKRIELIITEYDVPKADETVTEIFEIRYGDPVEIVELLKKLINGRPGAGAIIEQSKQPIVLIPEPSRKWIIAKASPENMKQIGEWIAKLDREEPAPTSLEQIDQQIIKQQKILKMRQDYINNDPVVKALSENVANAEKELIVARQKFTQSHPQVLQKARLLQLLKKRLNDMTTAVGKSFDDMMLPEPNLPLAPEVPLITNTFIDSDLVTVLQDIASMSGIPIIPDEKVVGYVTAELQNVPLDTALDIVLAGTPYVVKKTPYYYLVASAVEPLEIQKRVDSAKKLSRLGTALRNYADDYEDRFPDSMQKLQGYPYLNEEEFEWALANVKYLAKGKMLADPPDVILAYDKKILTEGMGTNILRNDTYVGFVKFEELKKLGISAAQILIDTKLVSVSEEFLKDIGLDANSVSSSDAWSEHLLADSPADPNTKTYSRILDELHVSFLLRAIQAHKDARVLSAPQVLCQEGKTAEIGIVTEEYFVIGYTEPNDPSDEPEKKADKVELGTRIWLKPELTPDNENVRLDFKLEIRRLLGYEERRYKGKYKYIVPRTEVVSTQTQLVVPDGKTLLIGGLKITEQEKKPRAPRLKDLPLIGGLFSSNDKIKDHKMLLILVKPIINPQQKASKILRGQEDSEEHIKSLARQLEKKLNPPAD